MAKTIEFNRLDFSREEFTLGRYIKSLLGSGMGSIKSGPS